MTLRQALTAAATQLARDEHLLPHAHRDAELLLLQTLHIPRVTLLAHPDRELSAEQLSLYEAALARRLRYEPIQYIIGQQEFYGLLLRVTPAVLIPRPETEHLVEAVLRELSPREPNPELKPESQTNHPLRIADIGTGSGAIAIALAANLPHAQITALDLSLDALKIAEANAREHNLSDRIRFLQSDLLSALAREDPALSPENTHPPEDLFDAIVSNPPYIPDADHPDLHPEVRDHEPHAALFAGPHGLDIYRRLIPEAQTLLKPNGLLALEIGHGQRADLAELLSPWHSVTFIDDLQHIPRVALARKP